MIKLQVKIILWIFIISATFLCGAQIENINSNELLAFEDFLRSEHLKHALLLPDSPQIQTRQIENYKRLFANYRMQFFTPQSGVQFQELFYYGAPRTALLVAAFERKHLKRWVYEAAAEGGYFNRSQAWFLLGHSRTSRTDEQIIRQHLSAYSINVDADITVAMRDPQANNLSWLLYDVYRVGQQTPLRVEPKGEWSPSAGYQLWDKYRDTWFHRRSDLGNITLIGSTAVLEKPADMEAISYLSNDKDFLQRDPMQRKTFQLFQLIGQMYNFSLGASLTTSWGVLLPNSSWLGIMGHVTSGEADFGVSPMRFVTRRHGYIQYSPVLHVQPIHFLFRHPRRSSIRNIFFEPLSTQVWWCVLALMVGSSLLLLLHVRQERRLQQQQQEEAAIPVEGQISFVWFTTLETFLQQGPATNQFQLPSTRLLISASCIFSFVLMQFYGAFIVGSLLSDTPRTIVNLQALYDSGVEIGMEDIGYNHEIFTNTSYQLVRDVYSQRICRRRPCNIMTIEEGAERIKRGGFAFHTAIDRLYRVLSELLDERRFCDLQEILFTPVYQGAAILPKGSPWREYINFAILYFTETGLAGHNARVWIVPKLDCTLVKGDEVEVDLKDFAPALFTLVLAVFVSMAVLLVELFFGWRKLRARPAA